MDKKQKVSIWYVVLGIWFILIIQNLLITAFAIKTIPYSEFLKLLKENRIVHVAISANQIEGKLKDKTGEEQMFRTVRVDPETSDRNRSHPPLVPTLRRGNLIFAKAALILCFMVQRSPFPRRSAGTRSGGGVNGYIRSVGTI